MQTLYAIGALALVMLLALSVQRATVRVEDRMIRNEGEALALAAAAELLDHAGALPFDAHPDAAQPTDLTPAADFGTPTHAVEAAADVDDLQGVRDTVLVAAPGGTIPLVRTATVRYLRPDGVAYAPAATRTFVKEVTVVVRAPHGASATLTRVFGHRPGLRS